MLAEGRPSEILALEGMDLFKFWMHVWTHHDELDRRNSKKSALTDGGAGHHDAVQGGGRPTPFPEKPAR
jgi:hypothetical protein